MPRPKMTVHEIQRLLDKASPDDTVVIFDDARGIEYDLDGVQVKAGPVALLFTSL